MSDRIMCLINQLKEARGWSETELAEALGVEDQLLAKIRAGEPVPFHVGLQVWDLLKLPYSREAMMSICLNKQTDLQADTNAPVEQSNFISQLDTLKQRRNWSDAELALQIGLADRQHLAKIRAGERPIPFEVKVRAWDLLGYVMTRDAILALMPEKFAQRLREADNRRNRQAQ